jgi:thioredoxin 1
LLDPAVGRTYFHCEPNPPPSRPAVRDDKDNNMPSKPISDDSFEADVLQSDKPVLVDFWAEWCGPCKQIGPTLEELSDDKNGELVVAKLNIDDNPMTPSKYGVRGIPTLLLFKDGQVASMKVGSLPKSQIYDWVDSVL